MHSGVFGNKFQQWLFLYFFSISTYISKAEGDLQVAPEVIREFWIHVQHLQNILPLYFVQITVGQCSYISARLPRLCVQINGFPKYIILSCRIIPN